MKLDFELSRVSWQRMLQKTGLHGNGPLLIFKRNVTSVKVNSALKHWSVYKPNQKIHHVKKEKTGGKNSRQQNSLWSGFLSEQNLLVAGYLKIKLNEWFISLFLVQEYRKPGQKHYSKQWTLESFKKGYRAMQTSTINLTANTAGITLWAKSGAATKFACHFYLCLLLNLVTRRPYKIIHYIA